GQVEGQILTFKLYEKLLRSIPLWWKLQYADELPTTEQLSALDTAYIDLFKTRAELLSTRGFHVEFNFCRPGWPSQNTTGKPSITVTNDGEQNRTVTNSRSDANSANSNGNDSGNQENCQNQNLAIPTPRKPTNNEPIVEEIVRIGFTPSIKVAQNTSNRTEKKKPQKSTLEKLSNGSNETQRNSPTSKEEAEAIRQAKAASLQEQDGGG
ncbi:MAG: hypothetical protein GY738_21315, partial [Pseudoalteromonas sp.]|nr:hypothetical protein [Pseudoalteromonas sp.]